jgi:CPA2 family monovalent cation:H+ antiporter-2
VLLGYIAAGILLGPHTRGLSVSAPHEIELLAEIGVALLLFAIGIEFSLSALRAVQRIAIAGTVLQLLLTIALGAVLGRALGWSPAAAVWFGALISVSSTMVVLRVLASSGFLGTLSSRVMLGMLIVQDLAVVPLMIILPQVGKAGGDPAGVALAVGRAALFLALLVPVALRLVPWMMSRVAGWRSRELFVLTVVALGLGIGYLSHLAGLSYALGAFIAGLVISESEYGHQALSDIIPLRDLFGLLFFASVGMLFDPRFFVAHLRELALIVLLVIVGKGLIFAGIARFFGYRNVVPLAMGLGLSQIGEFSFLLAQLGLDTGGIDQAVFSLTVSTALVTMALTPYLSQATVPIYERWRRRRAGSGSPPAPAPLAAAARPVLIAGAGRVGQQVAAILAEEGLPFCVIDFDHRRFTEARAHGWPAVFGDAAQAPVLAAAGVASARLAVITLPSAVGAQAVAARMRELAPGLPLVARSEGPRETAALVSMGVVHVVEPELEAGLEMARQALVHLEVEPARMQRFLDATRRAHYGDRGEAATGYAALRGIGHATQLLDLQWIRVEAGSRFDGARLGELQVRSTTGVSVVAVLRGETIHYSPGAEQDLAADDWLGVIGRPLGVEAVAGWARQV